ncbi:TolB family protein [Agromyces sp. NPDC056523]|uniref:TolB family protein n=1 Tax=Agromyces sp. NPDC056523 TaxID=3345850 RepID=UPI00366B8042
MREPVEALFEEARRRSRRRRLAIGAAIAGLTALAAIAATSSLNGAEPPQGREAALGAPSFATPLGVFEPLRGRIVYLAGDELVGVDPADPPSVTSIPIPDEMRPRPVVTGWSADGTRLALASEESDWSYVMDAEGGVTEVKRPIGCCLFVRTSWLAPDGRTALSSVEADRIRLRDLDGGSGRVIGLEPPVGPLGAFDGGPPEHVWSPDGTRIAFIVFQQVGGDFLPSIVTADLETGATRELVGQGFGHIRHMTWSPDGARLLVIAGAAAWGKTQNNPLTRPQETAMYVVDADRSAPTASPAALEPIASGHYIAGTWSPDGEWVAALDSSPTGRDLVLMRADGAVRRLLVDRVVPVLFTGLAWHPIGGKAIPDDGPIRPWIAPPFLVPPAHLLDTTTPPLRPGSGY